MLLTVGDSVLTSPVLVWGGEYAKILQSVLDGNAELDPSVRNLWNGIDDETWRLSDLSPRVPPEAKAHIDVELSKLKNGEDTIFCKPGLTDNKGRARNDPSKPNPAVNPVPWEATHIQAGTTCLTDAVVNQVCQEYTADGKSCVDHWLVDGVFDFCEPTTSNPAGYPLINGACYLGSLDIPDKCPSGHELTLEGCKPCPAGSFGDDEKCTLCPEGYFADGAGMEKCLPCEPGFAASEPGALQCARCPVGTFTNGFAADQCLECPAGTYGVNDVGSVSDVEFSNGNQSNATLGCVKCPLNSYSVGAGATECTACGHHQVTLFTGAASPLHCICDEGTYLPVHEDPDTKECQRCPGGMSCSGGAAQPTLMPGYWAEPSDPYVAMKCYSKSVCPGGEVDDDVCMDGRKGRNCGVCKEYWYSATRNTGPCEECGDADIVPMIFAIIFFIALPMLLHHVCNGDNISSKPSQAMVLAAVMGQIISYSQIFSMVGTFNVSWPQELQHIFRFYDFFMLHLQLLRPACLFGSWDFGAGYISGLLLPFLFAGVYLLEYAIIKVCSKFTSIKPLQWDLVCNTLGRVFQVCHVAILKQVTTVLECYEHPNGQRSLVMFPEVLCGEDEHMSIIPATSIVLFLYCVVFFGYLCWVAHVAPVEFAKKSFARKHRYLLLKFRPDKWYWAVPIFVRNTLLAFIVAVAPDFPIVQICVFNIVLMIFLALTLLHSPWKDPKNNMLDAALTMILMVFSLAALPLAPFDNRLVWPLTMIMILSVSLEFVLVGLVVGRLAYTIAKQALRNAAKKVSQKKETAVVPTLSEIGNEHHQNGNGRKNSANADEKVAWSGHAASYQPTSDESVQERQRKLESTFQEVIKYLAASSTNSISEFLANLTIYDARLVHKFVRLMQTEFIMATTTTERTPKSDQRLQYNMAQKEKQASAEKTVTTSKEVS
jgi:hypothetical protein